MFFRERVKAPEHTVPEFIQSPYVCVRLWLGEARQARKHKPDTDQKCVFFSFPEIHQAALFRWILPWALQEAEKTSEHAAAGSV